VAKCKESAGVLYPHPCTRESVNTCGRCGKLICGLHTRQAGGGAQVCISCHRAATPPSDSGGDALFLASMLFPDYDTGTAVRRRLNQAMGDDGMPLDDFETEFDGT